MPKTWVMANRTLIKMMMVITNKISMEWVAWIKLKVFKWKEPSMENKLQCNSPMKKFKI